MQLPYVNTREAQRAACNEFCAELWVPDFTDNAAAQNVVANLPFHCKYFFYFHVEASQMLSAYLGTNVDMCEELYQHFEIIKTIVDFIMLNKLP